MITKQQKIELVKELTDKFKKQKITVFTDFQGVAVSKLHQLRRQLHKGNAEYKVARKTLIDRAAEEVAMPLKTKELKGEIGITFGYEDEAGITKVLIKFRKENETFKILGGVLGGKVLSEKDIVAFSRLPSREILLAQVVGALQGPIRGLVTVLNGNLRNLVVVLNKIKENKEK
ncbi:MAG: 50S ribosomal protein L10 [Candidatus Sungbacteria bacterium]|nr:50S ribosomal protein L10 [Candidatus Sungbacteria bacterium]